MRASGLVSISPYLAKSTLGQGIRSSAAPPPRAPSPDGAVSVALTNCSTSLRKILPLRPVPLTRCRSAPSSRANLRTDGLACGLCSKSAAPSLGNSRGIIAVPAAPPFTAGSRGVVTGAARCSAFSGCDSPSCAGTAVDGAAGSRGAAAIAKPSPPSAAACGFASTSSTTIGEPSETLSPSSTLSSLTIPSDGDGTSVVALSDSMVMSDCSARTSSPGLTIISMTSTSLKSPMSGSLTSTRVPMICVTPSPDLVSPGLFHTV